MSVHSLCFLWQNQICKSSSSLLSFFFRFLSLSTVTTVFITRLSLGSRSAVEDGTKRIHGEALSRPRLSASEADERRNMRGTRGRDPRRISAINRCIHRWITKVFIAEQCSRPQNGGRTNVPLCLFSSLFSCISWSYRYRFIMNLSLDFLHNVAILMS